MLRLIKWILLCAISQCGFSQNLSIITGRITDEKGETLSGAHILVLGKSKGIVSDSEGNFELHGLTSGEYTLQITYLGYLTHEELIKVSGPADVSIVMKEDQHMLPQLFVIGKHDQLFTKVPGSVSFVGKEEMARIKPLSGNEVFRRVPGLNVVDEEGAGLRVNIGIRGLDPDRSRNVLMMEDGVPVSLSPYGEPEMYYTPAMDRMIGVEVLKGSGQILYGPQTVGGVINYITADPPEQEEIMLRIQGGEGSYLSALGSYGNTFNNTGLQLNYLHKQADAIGPTRFNVNDFSTKIKFQLSDKSTVGVKLGAYNETSNSTYVGITQPMFEKGGNDYSVLMPNDELDVDRYLMSFSHRVVLSEKVNLQSALYGYTTTRNWRRQDYSYNTYINGNPNPPPSDWTGVVWGDESVPGGAIYLRDRNGNRDRQFEVIGWEQKVNYSFLLGQVQNDLIGGYRFMYEQAHELR
ncbi:MAG: carboxypeptidase-like regulatory domain-containing protein, partial [Cyclobacteriaceae bacterium]|nr:carboxypeptidase-like regulatory domain-containing protein [Cyclobacteriaceae bacterium]